MLDVPDTIICNVNIELLTVIHHVRLQIGYEHRINWNKTVMPAIIERLDAFNNRGIAPTLRAMFYALVSLRVIPNVQAQYQYLSHFTASIPKKSL